ncbi:SanA/YdcF family protein [Salinispira pacifica]
MIRKPRFIPFFLSYSLFALLIFLIAANSAVSIITRGRTFERPDQLPPNRVGLLLGTAKYTAPGEINLFFEYRIRAAVELYRLGLIRVIVASGDNGKLSYNEPMRMKEELVLRGIPRDDIYLDYAGFSTLDSIVRINRIFGQDRFTVISQRFHNERAIFIARFYGLNAVGFNARDVSAELSWRVRLREYLARAKAFLDLYVLDTQPKYLGEPVHLD